jgi:HK97 family phage prohead protease
MYGGPANYGWIERIDPKAFDVTLREKPDLHLLINHAGMPLARTKSGTSTCRADEHGLKVTATLDKRDPEVQSLAVKMERGDMDEMSFAFRVKAQEWRAADGYEEIDDQSYRTITEVSLHKGDVSVVNWGANPTTSVGIRCP